MRCPNICIGSRSRCGEPTSSGVMPERVSIEDSSYPGTLVTVNPALPAAVSSAGNAVVCYEVG